jgi:hypothetical protein
MTLRLAKMTRESSRRVIRVIESRISRVVTREFGTLKTGHNVQTYQEVKEISDEGSCITENWIYNIVVEQSFQEVTIAVESGPHNGVDVKTQVTTRWPRGMTTYWQNQLPRTHVTEQVPRITWQGYWSVDLFLICSQSNRSPTGQWLRYYYIDHHDGRPTRTSWSTSYIDSLYARQFLRFSIPSRLQDTWPSLILRTYLTTDQTPPWFDTFGSES